MSIAPLTTTEISWDLFQDNCLKQLHPEIKIYVVPLYRDLDLYLKSNKIPSNQWIQNTLLRLEACLDRVWEELNTGHWKNVLIQYRYSYTICSILKCIILEIQSVFQHNNKENDGLIRIAQQIDKSLLLGANLEGSPDLLTNMASRINKRVSNELKTDKLFMEPVEIAKELLPGCEWVNQYETPSMETFYRELFTPKIPGILEGCIDHWRALTLWKDPNYLIKVAGIRTVPIEIGSSYVEEDWSQHLLTLKDFIQSYLTKATNKKAYLAQHQLFEQIPELKDDFSVPDYCSFTDSDDTSVDINAWFGPGGTVSPLHYDAKNNLLCQVFGWKKIILYSPDDGKYLYQYDTRLLNNTAQVDPLNVDYEKFPHFKKAKGKMCYIGPGEMLYMPPKWWHHVVSLSPSFSISFWWN